MKSSMYKKLVMGLLMAAMIMTVGGAVMADSPGQIHIKIHFGGNFPYPGFPFQPPIPPQPNGGNSPSQVNEESGPTTTPPSTTPQAQQPRALQATPPGNGGFSATYVGGPEMFVNSYGQTVAGVYVGGNAALYVKGNGVVQVVEYVWTGYGWVFHDSASRYNYGPAHWTSFWFFGDYVGVTPYLGGTWHALQARIGFGPGAVRTGWIYIFVYGG